MLYNTLACLCSAPINYMRKLILSRYFFPFVKKSTYCTRGAFVCFELSGDSQSEAREIFTRLHGTASYTIFFIYFRLN